MAEVVLAYGGGVNSTAAAVLYENRIKEMVFCDHGGDYPETYEYVRYMEAQGFPITLLKPNVQGFDNLPDYYESRRIMPNRVWRDCTDKFKLTPQTKYYRANGIDRIFIGFSAGEEKRVKSEFKFRAGITAQYPLIHDGVTREDCIEVIEKAGLRVPRRSCCWLCFNCSPAECRQMAQEHPDLWERRKRMRVESLRNSAERRYNVLPNFI